MKKMLNEQKFFGEMDFKLRISSCLWATCAFLNGIKLISNALLRHKKKLIKIRDPLLPVMQFFLMHSVAYVLYIWELW